MTTKEQERKALEQIKKIVSGLEENSWVATALDGMIEDAEENIENDFANTWKGRAKDAETRAKAFRAKAEAYDELKKHHDVLLKDFDQMRIEKWEAENELGCTQNRILEMEDEIIHLKAKLYDLMVNGA